METVYFHCGDCYNAECSRYTCVTDQSILESLFDSNMVTWAYYDSKCSKCQVIESLIDGPKYVRAKYGDNHYTSISKRRIFNFGYVGEYGMFQFVIDHDMTILKQNSRYYSGMGPDEEPITMEEFSNQTKLKTLIDITEIPFEYTSELSRINTVIEDIERHLADKNLCIKYLGHDAPSNYYLVVNQPLIKHAEKI